MNLAAKCVSYVVIVGGLSLGFADGARWLASPDSAGPRVASVPPPPPRIAESIARKQEPAPPPLPAVASRPLVAPPAMQEANAALHPQPVRQAIRDLRNL